MPGLLTTDELASMRETMESDFDQTCTRTRIAAGSISTYGDQQDGATTTASYACRVRHDKSRNDAEPVVGDAPTSVNDWRILLPHNADVTPKDTLTVGSDVFQVQETDEEKSDRLCLVATCSKLTPNPARSA
jgi:hypothetical protein